MASNKSSAFDLTDAQLRKGAFGGCTNYTDLAVWLTRELDDALAMRGDIGEAIKYRWAYYEQTRTRRSSPWPDAADLTSPYGTEFVDAILARVMDTIMVDPLWIVEGWGESAKKAPFVEEFHQRAQEQERLQGYLREVLLRALAAEPCGVLQISTGVDYQRVRKPMRAKVETNELGGVVIDAKGQPVLVRDEAGKLVEAAEGEAAAEIDIDEMQPVRTGPVYDAVPYLDYIRLPQHARAKSEIWGYAKRFWRRVPELEARAAKGIYGKDAVKELGGQDERAISDAGVEPMPTHLVTQQGPTAQKELWELSLLADLDGQGARWYVLTLSREHRQILRCKVDDGTTRFLEFRAYIKPGSLDGYSVIEKAMTLLEEDSAVRNMRADRASLAVAAPLKRMTGALWDPYEQPFGPAQVIDVRDMNEVQQMVVSDVPQSLNVWRQDVRTDLEREIGLNDVSVGNQTESRRTLGEVQLAAGYSEVRVKAIISNIQEPLEELGQIRNVIWIKTLKDKPEGLPAPSSFMTALDIRGIETQTLLNTGRITADMLEGQFWFKPRGSVETANLQAQASNFMGILKTLPALIQMVPSLQAIFSTPQAGKALLEQMLRVTQWPDKAAFLGSEAQRVLGAEHTRMADEQAMAALTKHPLMQFIQQMAGQGGGMPQGPEAAPPPQMMPPPAPEPTEAMPEAL